MAVVPTVRDGSSAKGATMSVLLAFTVEHAAQVTGVSSRRIRYWDKTGVLSPSLSRGGNLAAYGRIYSFRDLVGLRTLQQLRDDFGLPLQKLREIGRRLGRQVDTPWSSLRFLVDNGHLSYRDPDTQIVVSAIRPGQIAMPLVPDLSAIAQQTEEAAAKLTERRPEEHGTIVRHRHVLGNRPVLAGTRIPTAAVWDFHQAGCDIDEILREYPRLTRVDVEQAIAFEQERRQQRPAA